MLAVSTLAGLMKSKGNKYFGVGKELRKGWQVVKTWNGVSECSAGKEFLAGIVCSAQLRHQEKWTRGVRDEKEKGEDRGECVSRINVRRRN